MEDEEGIGLVLARATELRLKISDCIDKATTSDNPSPQKDEKDEGLENAHRNPKSGDVVVSDGNEEEDEGEDEAGEEEAERLLHIRDALESLENQLSSLQDLRQRQQYEKQVALAEIDYSRKMLLEKLKEYKGKSLEVIHETSAFVGEKVDYDNALLLPPYPSRPPHQLVLDGGYVLNLNLKRRLKSNGLTGVESPSVASKKQLIDAETGNSRRGFGNLIGSVAKVVIPLVGVISILNFSGIGVNLKERGMSHLRRDPLSGEKKAAVQCPPGKVLVVENGEARCMVKERVEIPFQSGVSNRDVKYGYG